MAPLSILRVWVMLAIASSFIMYQLYLFFKDTSKTDRLLYEKYTPIFRTKKKSTSTHPHIEPQWSEVVQSTATANEEANNPIFTHRSEPSNNFSDATGKFYDFQDLNAVTDKAISAIRNVSRRVRRKNRIVATKPMSDSSDERKRCNLPADLGPINATTSVISLGTVEKRNPLVKLGGRYTPSNCSARNRVAIIVPYRDREENLATFLNHMHPFLIKQQLDYGIFVVEQTGTREFNRGKLMNVGFIEAGGWECYIFHDVDLLPLDHRNVYSCPSARHPRLYDAIVEGNDLRAILKGNFGGVAAVTVEQFANANGYSNGYWGWGGEDNDLYYRLIASGYTISQYGSAVARYKALQHSRMPRNHRRYRLLLQTMKAFQMDGLSTLEYRLVSKTQHKLFTKIVVNVDHSYQEIQELFQEDNNFKDIQAVYVRSTKRRSGSATNTIFYF
ncbi:beta-1,4-N-acetylgalactosaminyltransferase bre-4-like isoform X2 [Leguminivora glycinivorella]|nr:beta-1,4-N-acetylgalactosaminyltransferase bre-4-like isoform X2 [Leguminivora glycinivorella]